MHWSFPFQSFFIWVWWRVAQISNWQSDWCSIISVATIPYSCCCWQTLFSFQRERERQQHRLSLALICPVNLINRVQSKMPFAPLSKKGRWLDFPAAKFSMLCWLGRLHRRSVQARPFNLNRRNTHRVITSRKHGHRLYKRRRKHLAHYRSRVVKFSSSSILIWLCCLFSNLRE